MAAKVSKSTPKSPQGLPKGFPRDPKRPQKTPQSTPQVKKKVDTLSKLGFVHRRSVLEPPKLKVDYHYYTLGTLKVLTFSENDENTAPAMLLETPRPLNLQICQPSRAFPSTPPLKLPTYYASRRLNELLSRIPRSFRHYLHNEQMEGMSA